MPPESDLLLFVDTNILLDLYRLPRLESCRGFLEGLVRCQDRLLITDQVEMEFKKNRQRVLLDSFRDVLRGESEPPDLPLVADLPEEDRERAWRRISVEQERIRDQIAGLLDEPRKHDPVFQGLEPLFGPGGPCRLDEAGEQREKLERRARRRFGLGYPPRKREDTSSGDALNWEWIVACAARSGKGVILVTRDGDFGVSFGGRSFVNDWLVEDFARRAGADLPLRMTGRLCDAFAWLDLPVEESLREAEESLLR